MKSLDNSLDQYYMCAFKVDISGEKVYTVLCKQAS